MSSGFAHLAVHESARAPALARRWEQALASRRIPAVFHYSSPRQADLWRRVAQAHSPVWARPEFSGIYRAAAAKMPDSPWTLLALGPGGAEKETWILQAKGPSARKSAHCIAVDASADLALDSAENCVPHCARATAVCADFLLASPEGCRIWAAPETPLLATAFGVSPNCDPHALAEFISGVLRPGDWCLCSANLDGCRAPRGGPMDAAILAQYDNPETRAWIWRAVTDRGLEAEMGEPEFAVAEHGPGWREIQCRAAGEGGSWILFGSHRFHPDAFEEILAAHGLSVAERWITPCVQEGVWLVSKA